MTADGFVLFATEIGRCAIVWGDAGIVGVQLPEAQSRDTRARTRSLFPGARETTPPPGVQRAIAAIVGLLCGSAGDLSAIALDMATVPAFHRRVYDVARTIAPGTTLTYGAIATRLGAPGSARAVGQALGRNPFAIVVPCHRVLAAGGKAGGFSANGGVQTKLRMLAIEGVVLPGARARGGPRDGFGFDPKAAVRHLRASDPVLARVIDAVGPFSMQLKKTRSTFVALSEAIVFQQLTAQAASTIFARVRALFPRTADGPTADQILRVADEKLRGAGLSRAKLLALRDLARRVQEGRIPGLAALRGMDNHAIIDCLTEVRGIGRWTVEMLLMFRLGRPDVLPADDYGIRKSFAAVFHQPDLPSGKDLERYGHRWAPYRTVASWYLWRALDAARTPR